jgi:hypothetical protein
VEGEAEWLPAARLQPGMLLRLVDGQLATVQTVEVRLAEESTFNLEVEEQHNFFVGERGVLVHNGTDRSAFESTVEVYTHIYEVKLGGKVVYVGKTVHPDVNMRLLEHINDPNSALYMKEFGGNATLADCPYRIDSVRAGTWTPYETAVNEQHFIDRNGGKAALRNSIDAITVENYQRYRDLHNACR